MISAVQLVRYVVVLVTGFIAGSRSVDAIKAWQNWQTRAAQEPSAADAYRTFFLGDAAMALLSLSIAGLVWWLLRPSVGSR